MEAKAKQPMDSGEEVFRTETVIKTTKYISKKNSCCCTALQFHKSGAITVAILLFCEEHIT